MVGEKLNWNEQTHGPLPEEKADQYDAVPPPEFKVTGYATQIDLDALRAEVQALKNDLAEAQADLDGITPEDEVMVLGPDEPVPPGTAPGVVIVRKKPTG